MAFEMQIKNYFEIPVSWLRKEVKTNGGKDEQNHALLVGWQAGANTTKISVVVHPKTRNGPSP